MKLSVSILGIKDDIEKIREIEKSHADYIHLDIMDGEFVSNKVDMFNNYNKTLDIHLMVNNIKEYIDKYKLLKPVFRDEEKIIRLHNMAKNYWIWNMKESNNLQKSNCKQNRICDKCKHRYFQWNKFRNYHNEPCQTSDYNITWHKEKVHRKCNNEHPYRN